MSTSYISKHLEVHMADFCSCAFAARDPDRCTCLDLDVVRFSGGSVKPHANEWEKDPMSMTQIIFHNMKDGSR